MLFFLEAPTFVAETCPTCGKNTKNPLVEMGIVPASLGKTLASRATNGEEKGINKASAERPSFDFKPDCWRTDST
ncbi:hypothetical protein DPMN_171258 [Dreissena polymorpha]|uniref:Uncharacterized protein n=1 Tax=Dreissena polymorpha TaxID=45954 RepID=A0A9D4E0W1_DREPO|nr:hypothetical protein DPMN_171258 [Dreissena polymorpha]